MTVAEQMVSVPDTSTLFLARRSELRLVKKSILQTRDAEGRAAETIPGETVEFREGVLRIPAEGQVTLSDGRTCDVAEVLDWLERHPMKGDVQEGFWRVDPTAPPPSSTELELMQELAMDLDVEGLERFIVQERDGWERPALIDVAERSLERIRAKLAENEAKLEQARKEGAASATPPPAPKGTKAA